MLDAGRSEIARFLAQHTPFTSLSGDELGELVVETEIEFHPAGTVILSEGGDPVTFLRIIHSGAIDITHRGKVLDLLGTGDTFGHAAMMSGLPPGFEARSAEDTLCYRIPVAVARPLLDQVRSEELRVTPHAPSHLHVSRLIRSPTLRCEPEQSISEVARRMTELGADCAVVELGEAGLGIVTDRDLRTRVLAAGLPASAPVSTVMTTPVFTVSPDRMGGEVLFDLLERGIRHAPIVTENGQLVGVVDEADLFAAQPRPWFGARRAIAHASGIEELERVAKRLPRILLDLHSSSLKALEVARVLSALEDALVARALALCSEKSTPSGIVWVAVGTHARRELTPASLTRGAFVFDEPPSPEWLAEAHVALAACGLARPPIARSADQWKLRAGSEPQSLAVLIDRRPLWGTPTRALPIADDAQRRLLLDQLAAEMLEYAPPTGFDEGAMLDLSGARSERFDIRRAAIAPIVRLARWGGVHLGTTEGSTLDRLATAAERGVLTEADARSLSDAFELAYQLRVDHQLEQIVDGREPDDLLDTAQLSTLTRRHLRDLFRAVTAVQLKLPA